MKKRHMVIIRVILIIFFIILIADETRGVGIPDKEETDIIRDFLDKVLKLRIENLDVLGKDIQKKIQSPQYWGIEYKCFSFESYIGSNKKLIHVLYLDKDKKKIFNYNVSMLYKVGNEYVFSSKYMKAEKSSKLLTMEESFEKVKPLLDYYAIEAKDFKDFRVREIDEYGWIEFWKPTLYEDTPCRYKEFTVTVSRCDGMLRDFFYVLPQPPVNIRPVQPIPNTEEVEQIVQQWARKDNYLGRFSIKVDKEKEVILVIAPGVNVFYRLMSTDKNQKHNFYWAWEIPISWDEYNTRREGMIWIEPNNKEVIGAAPNRFENIRKKKEEIKGDEENCEESFPGFLHYGEDEIGTVN